MIWTGKGSCSSVADPVYLLDSNICIYVLEGGGSSLRDQIERCTPGEIVISSISYAEVMRGIPALEADKIEKAERFFDFFGVLEFSRAAALCYRDIPFKQGSFDRLIAAHALSLGLVVVTNNEDDFADVPGLKVENWTN